MGVSLNEYLGWDAKLTHRQSSLWKLFRDWELNNPSLTDTYIMQLTATVARILAKNPQQIETDHFKITFTRKEDETIEDKKKQAEQYKDLWIARVGGMKALTIMDEHGRIIKHPEVKAKVVPKRKEKPIAPPPTSPQRKNRKGRNR